MRHLINYEFQKKTTKNYTTKSSDFSSLDLESTCAISISCQIPIEAEKPVSLGIEKINANLIIKTSQSIDINSAVNYLS